MGRLSSLLWGAAIGAGLMYFLDPENGNRRKALVRDQVYRLQNKGDEALDTAFNDLRMRTRGLLAQGMAMVSEEGIPDDILEQRIRSRIGFFIRHPGAVEVNVQGRKAILSGDVLEDEVDDLVKGVHQIRGVKELQNNLRTHRDAGNIPQLQGEGWLPGSTRGSMQWSPSARLLAGFGAAYLLLYGMIRGGIIGVFSRMGGFALGARALTNMDMRRMTGVTQEGDTIQVRKSIQINAPVEDVYQLWSNFENFPRFMKNIDSIQIRGDNRSHWVVKGPVGSKVEFDAITTENIPNQLVAWETTPDSMVKHKGQVRFNSSGDRNTQINVNMSYTPPGGVAGHAVASIFGKDPKTEMDSDLARMKSLLEKGKTSAGGQRVRREEVMPVTGSGSGSQRHTETRQGKSPSEMEIEAGQRRREDDEDEGEALAPRDL